ncbi:MAG: YdcF family protein [bacterium]|nr:YdcF family protein [bacterium]
MLAFLEEMSRFIFLEDVPQKADVILIPGSNQGALADTAAKLWKEGWAPYVLPSGKYSKITGKFAGERFETEWEYLADRLLQQGVPKEAILREDRATYTYENAIFSREVTDAAGMEVKTAIICCQAYHARRCQLYYQVCFPDTKFLMCPTVTHGITKDNWFESEDGRKRVLGEIERCGSQFHEIVKNAAHK